MSAFSGFAHKGAAMRLIGAASTAFALVLTYVISGFGQSTAAQQPGRGPGTDGDRPHQVDGGGLENHCTRKGTGGSNPSPSAKPSGVERSHDGAIRDLATSSLGRIGARARTVVPRVGCGSMNSSPPTSFKRSFMLVRPSPGPRLAASTSKPTPSSRTVRWTASSVPRSWTSKCRTRLCRSAFCRAS